MDEDFVRHDLEYGPHRMVEHAVSLLQAHQTWFAEQRAEVAATGTESLTSERNAADGSV